MEVSQVPVSSVTKLMCFFPVKTVNSFINLHEVTCVFYPHNDSSKQIKNKFFACVKTSKLGLWYISEKLTLFLVASEFSGKIQ